MSASLGEKLQSGEDPCGGGGLLLSVAAAASALPVDALLAGMVAAGQGIQAICLYLGLTRAALAAHLVRLGLPTPHDRPLRGGGARGWSVLDTMRLIAWRVAGVHPEIIGRRLGRTANAVRAKTRRLGIPAPGRKALHKPDPETLQDPVPSPGCPAQARLSLDSPTAMCGRAAGALSVAGSTSVAPASVDPEPSVAAGSASVAVQRSADTAAQRTFALVAPVAPAAAVATSVPIAPGARERRAEPLAGEDQGELPFADVVAGAGTGAQEAGPVRNPSCPRLPPTETDVDLSGDLSWIGGVKKKALWNRPLVWALGMLYMGGLHWKEIARRTGMKEGSLRSLRTRCGIPVDHDRTKQTTTFDEEIARVTWRASGYVVKQCQKTGQFFWEHKSRRGCNTSPMVRRKDGYRDTMIEGRCPTFTLILAPYNVDYYNYPTELNAASRRFTIHGWNTFANSFINTGNFAEIKRASLLCHAQPARAALFRNTTLLQGALAYEVQLPITQTCENANQTSTNNLMITAVVVRTNDDDHPDGLAVDQLVASPR